MMQTTPRGASRRRISWIVFPLGAVVAIIYLGAVYATQHNVRAVGRAVMQAAPHADVAGSGVPPGSAVVLRDGHDTVATLVAESRMLDSSSGDSVWLYAAHAFPGTAAKFDAHPDYTAERHSSTGAAGTSSLELGQWKPGRRERAIGFLVVRAASDSALLWKFPVY